MLARLRIGPKLLLAPALVLVLPIVSSSGAWYAMVRQNHSLVSIVQVRAARDLARGNITVRARLSRWKT
jgi:hypothetical protein